MKRIFLFIALFFNSLNGMENFSSECCEGDSPLFNIFPQKSPKFWRIIDKRNPSLNYKATETSIKIILDILNLLQKQNSEIVNNIYLSSIFSSTEKVSVNACKQILSSKYLAKLMILIKNDGTIQTEWIRNLIAHSILFEENKILTFEELRKNKIIIPVKEEEKTSFWKIDNKTFATDTIRYVISALKQLYEKNYSTIVKLKKMCDQDDNIVSPDLAKILYPYRFVKTDRTLNLWAKIITSKVLYKHSKYGIQIHNFGYLEEKSIITPCQNDPIPNQEINEFDSDIISSEPISKEEEEYDDKKKIDCPNINVQLNYVIMQENEPTCTSNAKINCNNSN